MSPRVASPWGLFFTIGKPTTAASSENGIEMTRQRMEIMPIDRKCRVNAEAVIF